MSKGARRSGTAIGWTYANASRRPGQPGHRLVSDFDRAGRPVEGESEDRREDQEATAAHPHSGSAAHWRTPSTDDRLRGCSQVSREAPIAGIGAGAVDAEVLGSSPVFTKSALNQPLWWGSGTVSIRTPRTSGRRTSSGTTMMSTPNIRSKVRRLRNR